MKLAIMQPYFVPYLGYWQLLNTVDRFVIYDDVNYITRGWINRNRILINGQPNYLTISVEQASQNRLINDLMLNTSLDWRNKLIQKIENTYRKAPYFDEIFPLVEMVIKCDETQLSMYLTFGIKTIAKALKINTEIVTSSSCYGNTHLKGQDRILDICLQEGVTTYINPQGGQVLYDSSVFQKESVDLKFITMQPMTYKQPKADHFVPYLSIVDVLMAVGTAGIGEYLETYELSCKGANNAT